MLKKIYISIIFIFFIANLLVFAQDSGEFVKEGWFYLGQKKYEDVFKITDQCIANFSQAADNLANTLGDFPPSGKEDFYKIMNDVATCYFIKAEAYKALQEKEKALSVLETLIKKYPYAQAWDPRGWFWKIKEKAELMRCQLDDKFCVKGQEEKVIISKVKLYDSGTEFPVDYERYGKFFNEGSNDYYYKINDIIGLSEAVGEGIYPNTSALKFDPRFIELRDQLSEIDHWDILNSRDLEKAFYKWNIAAEPIGVRLFYIAHILERSGEIKQAIKAYYALLVHFPRSISWSYWDTPIYLGKVAMYKINYLVKKYPNLDIYLDGADIEVINGYDNDVRNDKFIINPGRLIKKDFFNRLCSSDEKHSLGKISRVIGKGKVKLVQYENKDWQLQVDGKPFIIKGVTYSPTRVGESPDDGSLQDWMKQDVNGNGIIDAPYEAWVDKNKNNQQDKDEKNIGDFQLMKEMGVNTIRVYVQPFYPSKEILRDLYQRYGIYTVIGNFLGKYAFDSGATWKDGTDYDNPEHKKNMLDSVRKMVLEFKDEPYVLMWLLGNENVYGLGCNADKKPTSFFKFANEVAKLIKELDPQKRPVAISSGDTLYLDIFAKECEDIDIYGANVYRGDYGFLDFWKAVRTVSGKAAMITEYGTSAYAKGYSLEEAEDYQAQYHYNAWEDIISNYAGRGYGNALGGFAFEWLDEWWKAYEPSIHDKEGQFHGPFLDGVLREEWLGICSQGNGKNSPFMRQLRKVYYIYKELWQK